MDPQIGSWTVLDGKSSHIYPKLKQFLVKKMLYGRARSEGSSCCISEEAVAGCVWLGNSKSLSWWTISAQITMITKWKNAVYIKPEKKNLHNFVTVSFLTYNRSYFPNFPLADVFLNREIYLPMQTQVLDSFLRRTNKFMYSHILHSCPCICRLWREATPLLTGSWACTRYP